MASRRREEILLRSAELFAEKGVAPTTVREIAQRVGILSGSLYHYFPSKDAIAYAIVMSFIDDLNEGYESIVRESNSPKVMLEKMVATSFRAAIEHPYATEIYQNENLAVEESERLRLNDAVTGANRFWEAMMVEGVATGDFRSDVDPKQAHRILRETVWSSVRFNRSDLAEKSEKLQHDIVLIFTCGFYVTSTA